MNQWLSLDTVFLRKRNGFKIEANQFMQCAIFGFMNKANCNKEIIFISFAHSKAVVARYESGHNRQLFHY